MRRENNVKLVFIPLLTKEGCPKGGEVEASAVSADEGVRTDEGGVGNAEGRGVGGGSNLAMEQLYFNN